MLDWPDVLFLAGMTLVIVGLVFIAIRFVLP